MINPVYCISSVVGTDVSQYISTFMIHPIHEMRADAMEIAYINIKRQMEAYLCDGKNGIFHNPQHLGYIKISLRCLENLFEEKQGEFNMDTFIKAIRTNSPLRSYAMLRKDQTYAMSYLGCISPGYFHTLRCVKRLRSVTNKPRAAKLLDI